uniref:Aa_trans domain-containing protein n=2 Tax=Panagrellus redivivus TaxID=6233 RepID=A0A7E4ZWT3_PANRE
MKDKNQSNPQEGYSLVSNSANTMETVECGTKFRNLKGMGWIVTCLFIVGETAGGGLIAMPAAMVSTGLIGGIFVIMLGAAMCAYTGNLLSENWTILQQRWPEYRNHCRKPYPAMGLRALGPRFMTVVSSCLNVTQFGTAVVFLLLAAKNLESFLQSFGGVQIGFCYLVLFVAMFMLPFTMLKSPKDFWWAVIGAMVTTTIAVTLIIRGAISDGSQCLRHVNYAEVVPSKFFMCFGTVMFAYGGHGAFPTIQHDMRKPYHFKRSVYMAFFIIFLMYLPVSVIGYIVYGDSLRDSVIPSLQEMYIQQAVNALITMHVILALTIVFNPLNQELEDVLNVPQDFGWKRFVARSAMMAAVVVVAETIPNFGVLLDLVGGSTITLMALVFPVIFNFYTTAGSTKYNGIVATKDEKPLSFMEAVHYTPKHKLAIYAIIMAFAIIGGGTASLSALGQMVNSQFSQPCYAGLWTTKPVEETILGNATELLTYSHHGKVNCCGMFKNISRFGDTEYCLDPSISVGGGSHG